VLYSIEYSSRMSKGGQGHSVPSLGHIGFYQSYIPGYVYKTYRFNSLLKKSSPFAWSVGCQHEFDCLLNSLISMLTPFDPSKDCVTYCDSSNFACASVLLQRDALNPEKSSHTERTNSQTLSYAGPYIIKNSSPWCRPSTSSSSLFTVVPPLWTPITNPLPRYAKKDPNQLSAKNLRWMEKIFTAKITLEYLPGISNVIADHLNRAAVYHHSLDPTIQVHTITTVTTDWTSSYPKLYKHDPIFSYILERSYPTS
jgi:hypothetical protein